MFKILLKYFHLVKFKHHKLYENILQILNLKITQNYIFFNITQYFVRILEILYL